MENVLKKTPVRQARIIPAVEWQNIKQYIRATALMHPLVSYFNGYSVICTQKQLNLAHNATDVKSGEFFRNI